MKPEKPRRFRIKAVRYPNTAYAFDLPLFDGMVTTLEVAEAKARKYLEGLTDREAGHLAIYAEPIE